MKDKEPLEELIRQLFPHLWSYPVNTMVPTLTETPQGRKLAMLAVVDRRAEKVLKNDEEEREVHSSAYLENNKYGIAKDLILSFHVECSGGTVALETSVPGDEKKAQSMLLEVLRSPGEIGIFVVNRERELLKVLKAWWDPVQVTGVLDELEEKKQ